MVQDWGAGVGGHAHLEEFLAWACVACLLRGLESDRGGFADLRGGVMGHALQEERVVSGVGCLHPVSYGVCIVGPRSTDGLGWY